MKFGYLRTDGDGHTYLIPEEKIEEWDDLTGDGDAPEDCEDWWEYALGGDYSDLKIVMPE